MESSVSDSRRIHNGRPLVYRRLDERPRLARRGTVCARALGGLLRVLRARRVRRGARGGGARADVRHGRERGRASWESPGRAARRPRASRAELRPPSARALLGSRARIRASPRRALSRAGRGDARRAVVRARSHEGRALGVRRARADDRRPPEPAISRAPSARRAPFRCSCGRSPSRGDRCSTESIADRFRATPGCRRERASSSITFPRNRPGAPASPRLPSAPTW